MSHISIIIQHIYERIGYESSTDPHTVTTTVIQTNMRHIYTSIVSWHLARVMGVGRQRQQYVHMKSQPKNEKYANGSVGARVRLMVRGGCLPVRGSNGMET